MHRSLMSAIAVLFACAGTAAAENPALTIYRADSDALFENGASPVGDGYAIVHESRRLKLAGGRQSLVVGGLPATLDPEAVSIDFAGSARILAQRVLSTGDGGALAAHRGEKIYITLRNGNLFQGVLLGLDGGALIVRDDASGEIIYVREYDALRFSQGSGLPGSTLQLAVDGKAGDVAAVLTYPTSGLGWRAAYSALLLGDTGCRMRLDALASVANRSGRDFPEAKLKLIAGSPNIAHQVGPRMYVGKAMAAAAAPEALPEQSAFGDYRSYAIDGTLDLPDASVTQVPLYASSELDCERRWIYESGGAWFPPKPMLAPGDVPVASGPVSSQLRFTTAENLPAGHIRVLTRDRDNRVEFLGEARLGDTQKGRAVPVTLGTAFDLSASRERTSFSIDKAAHEMNESFRIALSNTGENARTITVREHPNRWRAWSLLSSSQKPSKQTPDLLEFEVAVPANGKATLDYAVKYTWAPKDE